MKRILLGLVVVIMAVSPAFCEEHEFDLDKELEHLELMREQAGFEFDQQMDELELQERHIELDMMRREIERPQGYHQKKKDGHLFLVICGIVHILMAVWVYQDVRKRNQGNGIWIVITLLAGFFGASVYALIRIGDCKPSKKQE